MAEVAMRNIAPSRVDLVLADIFEPGGGADTAAPCSVLSDGGCDMELLARSAAGGASGPSSVCREGRLWQGTLVRCRRHPEAGPVPEATESPSSSRLQIDIRVPVGRPVPELAAFAAEVEAAGLDGIGVPDHHHTGRDAYLVLGAMAAATSRIDLYPATSNTVTRHPLVMAALASSLDELVPGRAFLTVAPGFLSVEKAGQAQERRQRLREVVLTLRGLLGTGAATFDDHPLELFHRPAGGSRVLLLASGPRLLELAGEVADGVMMLVGLDPGGVSAAREHVRRGAARAGRDPADLEEILIVPIGVGPAATQRSWVQGYFRAGQPWLEYPSVSNLRWLGHAGIDIPVGHTPGDILRAGAR
jgi:5,10-methylenetetrahydromethanopterin reductase